MFFDSGLGLLERFADDAHAAVGAEIDRAVRTDEVFAGDCLLSCNLNERHGNVGFDWL